MSSDPHKQVLIVDKKFRRKVLATVPIICIFGFFAIYFLEGFFQRLKEMAQDSPEQAFEQFGIFLGTFLAIGSISLILISVWMIRFSLKSFRTGQLPPPGIRVIRDTRIVLGIKARRIAILGLFIGIIFAVCGLLLPWQGWKIYSLLEASIHNLNGN